MQTVLNIHIRLVVCTPTKVSVPLKRSCYFAHEGCSDDGGPCRKFVPGRTYWHQVWRTHWWPPHSESPDAGRADGELVYTPWFPEQQRSICEWQQTPGPFVPAPRQLHAADCSSQQTSASTRQHLLTSAGRLLLQHPPLCLPALLPTDKSLR